MSQFLNLTEKYTSINFLNVIFFSICILLNVLNLFLKAESSIAPETQSAYFVSSCLFLSWSIYPISSQTLSRAHSSTMNSTFTCASLTQLTAPTCSSTTYSCTLSYHSSSLWSSTAYWFHLWPDRTRRLRTSCRTTTMTTC